MHRQFYIKESDLLEVIIIRLKIVMIEIKEKLRF